MTINEFKGAPQTKFVRCRNTMVSLIKEEPRAPAGNTFMIAMATVCFVFFVLGMIILSRC